MNVLQLIEQLQDLVEHSSMFPWPGRRFVDYEEFYRITEEIRRALPQELAQAAAILGDRDQVLTEAARETQGMVDEANRQAAAHVEVARQRAEELVSQEAVTRAAEYRGSEILATAEHHAAETLAAAEQEAEEVRASADHYAAEVLMRLDGLTDRIRTSVAEGRRHLEEEAAIAAAAARNRPVG